MTDEEAEARALIDRLQPGELLAFDFNNDGEPERARRGVATHSVNRVVRDRVKHRATPRYRGSRHPDSPYVICRIPVDNQSYLS